MADPKTKVTEFEMTPEVETAIAEKTVEGLKGTIQASVEEVVKPELEKIEANLTKKFEETRKKKVKGESEEGEEPTLVEKKKMFLTAFKNLYNGKFDQLEEYNQKVAEWREKAGYMNEATNADGAYVLLLPEFEAEIEKILPMYGVAMADATVRFVRANQIKTNKRASTVTMYETSEGVQKTGTKIAIGQDTVTLRKFAAIAVITDEMDDDAAIDFWEEFKADFAEEWARILDVLVFTDRVSSTYPGALYMPGINVETVGAAITSANWDDLANAEVKVPSRDMKNGKWYMHRTVWNIIRLSKDNEGRYQALPAGALQTPWGTPVELVDVMPASSVVGDSNEPYALFGDLKRVRLYIKGGLVLDRSNQATVHDAAGNAINLWEKDMNAIRAVGRAVALVKFPEALAAIGTGTVS